jgi:hypothetical protein
MQTMPTSREEKLMQATETVDVSKARVLPLKERAHKVNLNVSQFWWHQGTVFQ